MKLLSNNKSKLLLAAVCFTSGFVYSKYVSIVKADEVGGITVVKESQFQRDILYSGGILGDGQSATLSFNIDDYDDIRIYSQGNYGGAVRTSSTTVSSTEALNLEGIIVNIQVFGASTNPLFAGTNVSFNSNNSVSVVAYNDQVHSWSQLGVVKIEGLKY